MVLVPCPFLNIFPTSFTDETSPNNTFASHSLTGKCQWLDTVQVKLRNSLSWPLNLSETHQKSLSAFSLYLPPSVFSHKLSAPARQACCVCHKHSCVSPPGAVVSPTLPPSNNSSLSSQTLPTIQGSAYVPSFPQSSHDSTLEGLFLSQDS